MYSKIAVVAGLAAVAQAAPVAQGENWSSVWQSQLNAMKSTLAAMGQSSTAAPSAAPTGSASATGASTVTASVTSTRAPSASATPAASGSATGSASSAPAATGSASGSASAAPSATASAGTKVGSGSGPKVTGAAAWNGQDTGKTASDGKYNCYAKAAPAKPDNFPKSTEWGTFDNLWTLNSKLFSEGCANLGHSPNNNAQQNGWIKDAIQQVGSEAAVDPRFILAIVLQESHGCLAVPATNNGVNNPGLMQSHNGASFAGASASPDQQKASIVQMIRDGTQGTKDGPGYVQLIQQYGDVFTAARAYNSGSPAPDGNLDNGHGATKTYVEDVANRLQGWSLTPGTPGSCPAEA